MSSAATDGVRPNNPLTALSSCMCPSGKLTAPSKTPSPPFKRPPLPAAGMMTDGAGVPTGTPLTDPPLIEMISEDPVLRHTKLIAEAWDCDGLNQVGSMGLEIEAGME